MNATPGSELARALRPPAVVAVGLLLCTWSPALLAQATVAPALADAPDAESLRLFDANRDGRLDDSEMAVRRANTEDDIIELSPFVVNSSNTVGYLSENTGAGSRLNARLADVAASITVVTKQQLEDTASYDINDVFRYEANTEGSATYTPQILNRNFVNDAVAGTAVNGVEVQTNATANRVRGLGVPTTSLNYYGTIARVPFDAYNTQSVEISRGPNSNLFGLGSPAGVVNTTSARASLARDGGRVSASYGSYDSYRASMNYNKVLWDDKLAVYGAWLHDDRQFRRKPSYDITDRWYGTLTLKPFKTTQIRASVESYQNENRRPNFISPRDYVTPWRNAGSPMYNPVERTVTVNGVTRPGRYVLSTSSPHFTAGYNVGDAALHNVNLGNTQNPNPQYTSNIFFNDTSRPVLRIDNGEFIDWFQKQPVQVIPNYGTTPPNFTNPAVLPTTGTIYGNAASAAIFERRWTVSGPNATAPTVVRDGVTYTQSTYSWPGVTDPSIYDWETVSINQANYGSQEAFTYNLEFEQQLAKNWFLNLGWFKQDFDAVNNFTISQQQSNTLYVDTNTHLINGQPNPYAGLIYVEDFAPDTALNGETRETYRAATAYLLDFTKSGSNWVRWLGMHQLYGNYQEEKVSTFTERRRTAFTSADADGSLRYLPNPNVPGWNYQGISIRRNYYLASPGDPTGTVTHSTGTWGQPGYGGDFNGGQIEVWDWATNSFKKVTVGLDANVFDVSSGRNEREVESTNFSTQSFLWKDKIVVTYGWRKDDYRARNTTNGIIYRQDPDENGRLVQETPAMTNAEKWVNGRYQTDVVYNRWQRWDELSGETTTQGIVFRPFTGWDQVENPADRGNLFADFLRDLSFTYNKSDNFNPPTAAQVDVFNTPLPKPTGEGEDYGLRFTLFNRKLTASFNYFENTNQNERTAAANLILSRLTTNLDTTIFRNWATTVIRIQDGEDPTATNFGSATLTAAQEARIAQLWGLPSYNYYGNLSAATGATQDSQAKGYEMQLTYNPTRAWTVKVTFGKQESTYTNIAPQYDAWLAQRLPVMQSATARGLIPDNLLTYTNSGGTQVNLENFWSSYGYRSEVRLTNTDGNTNPANYYTNVVDSQYSLAKSQEGVAAPNQRKYRGSIITNYNFSSGFLNGVGVGGSLRWQSEAAIGYLGRAANPLTPTVLNAPDRNQPVFDDGDQFVDVWMSYTRKIFKDKIRMRLQFNVTNIFENGHLEPIAVNYDGSPYGFRIVDPREFRFTTTFDF